MDDERLEELKKRHRECRELKKIIKEKIATIKELE